MPTEMIFHVSDCFAVLLYLVCTVFLACLLNNKKIFHLFIVLGAFHFISAYLNSLGGTDARLYFSRASTLDAANLFATFNQGTHFIVFLTWPLVNFLNLSYLGCHIVYALAGLFGYYFLLRILLEHAPNRSMIYWMLFLLFLPGSHKWTSFIGKDAVIFAANAAMIYSFLKHKWGLFVLATVLSALIRLPVPIIMICGFVFVTFLFGKNTSGILKMSVGILVTVLLIVLMPSISERIGWNEDDSFDEFMENKEAKNQGQESSIDMSSSSQPSKMFAFLYRPLFFDSHNSSALFASCENIIWLLMSWQILRNILSGIKREYRLMFWQCAIAFGLSWVASSFAVSNLGLVFRLKYTFFPLFYCLLLFSMHNHRLDSLANHSSPPYNTP